MSKVFYRIFDKDKKKLIKDQRDFVIDPSADKIYQMGEGRTLRAPSNLMAVPAIEYPLVNSSFISDGDYLSIEPDGPCFLVKITTPDVLLQNVETGEEIRLSDVTVPLTYLHNSWGVKDNDSK